MLAIRPEQIEPFRQREIARFVAESCADLRDTHGDDLADLSEPELEGLVRYGIAVCGSYGIETELFVRSYLHLMIDLGEDFDDDPELPWAKAILLDDTLDEADVITALADAAEAAMSPAPSTPR